MNPAKDELQPEGGEPRPILQRLGARVREARRTQGLTLKDLAERSSLSPRFLVLLERGEGNVSVTRLEDLARALGTRPGALLDETASSGRWPDAPPHSGLRPVFLGLLGLRGAGKTTLGRAAAERLGLPFVELDARVSERAGLDLGTLFDMHGATYYRKLEREALGEVLASPAGAVIATGGGLVTDHASFALLRERTTTVWLRASAEDHWKRVVAQGDARPMANRTDAMKELRQMLQARRALYEQAEHVLDTSKLGAARALGALVKLGQRARAAMATEGVRGA